MSAQASRLLPPSDSPDASGEGRIAIRNRTLWLLRDEVAALSGLTPLRPPPWDRSRSAVALWAQSATIRRDLRQAKQAGRRCLIFDEGPLVSLRRDAARPLSLTADRQGSYRVARGPSDLLDLIADAQWFTPEWAERGAQAFAQLRRLRLLRLNDGPDVDPGSLFAAEARTRVLVIDQPCDHPKKLGALADPSVLRAMLEAARREHPEAEIIVRTRPSTAGMAGNRHLADLARTHQARWCADPANDWDFLEAADAVYTESSDLGLLAVLIGKPTTCFGTPFYSGWGFTQDRGIPAERSAPRSALQVFTALYLRHGRYFDLHSRREVPFETAAAQLAWLRDRFLRQERRSVCYRIPRWKRESFDRLLDSPAGRPLHMRSRQAAVRVASQENADVVAWASRDTRLLAAECEASGLQLIRAEDGFIRSAGLGASFVPPLSLAFDRLGIYYDSTKPSALEALIEAGRFAPELLVRAGALIRLLVEQGTTKYNLASSVPVRLETGGRPAILVPGQVEDDASIQRGSPSIHRNIDLLAAVRERNPDSFIVYKPHPDVESGLRRGRIDLLQTLEFADQVVGSTSILSLIGACDRMETMTSLAGFEALLRGKAVATHGQPFYSGWGLTEDLCPVARRTRRATIEELVAAALILYPQYLHPDSLLPCEVEELIVRLAHPQEEFSTLQRLRRRAELAAGRLLHIARSVRGTALSRSSGFARFD
jgi:capsular polysaccharide export protein